MQIDFRHFNLILGMLNHTLQLQITLSKQLTIVIDMSIQLQAAL